MANKAGLRGDYGHILVEHKGRSIPTSVGSRAYESMFSGQNGGENSQRVNGIIPNGYAHRPDLIANLFLNTPAAWWIVCERNAIFDVFEQLGNGDAIKLPTNL